MLAAAHTCCVGDYSVCMLYVVMSDMLLTDELLDDLGVICDPI